MKEIKVTISGVKPGAMTRPYDTFTTDFVASVVEKTQSDNNPSGAEITFTFKEDKLSFNSVAGLDSVATDIYYFLLAVAKCEEPYNLFPPVKRDRAKKAAKDAQSNVEPRGSDKTKYSVKDYKPGFQRRNKGAKFDNGSANFSRKRRDTNSVIKTASMGGSFNGLEPIGSHDADKYMREISHVDKA